MEIWSLGSRGQSKNFALTYGRAALPVYGIAIRLPWSLLNPAQGQYNFEPVTDAINASGTLKCSLSVVAGYFTPPWALAQAGATYTADGSTAPVPWDAITLANWATFVAALGAAFVGKFDHVVMTGPLNSKDQEILLPTSVNWQALGYSNSLIQGAFLSMGNAFAAAFPSVRFYPCMGRQFLPRVGRANPDDTANLIQVGIETWTQFGVQNNGFGHGMTPWSELYNVACPTGLQEGAPLGSTAAIQAAITAWVPVSAGFVEVFPQDLPLWPT